MLEELGRQGKDSKALKQIHRQWMEGGRLDRFLWSLASHLRTGFAREDSVEDLEELLEFALRNELGLRTPIDFPQPYLWELERLRREAGREADLWVGYPWQVPVNYCLETRLIRLEQGKIVPSRLGIVFLELRGREAVRWLLLVEALQSLGPNDEFRLDRSVARKLVNSPKVLVTYDDWIPDEVEIPSDFTLSRLKALKLLSFNTMPPDLTNDWGYRVFEGALLLLREIAEETRNPLRVMAEAMLDDEANALVNGLGAEDGRFQSGAAVQATTRHARMVAHELRNALVPVKVALKELYRAPDSVDEFRPIIDAGLGQVFRFVEEMLRLNEAVEDLKKFFDLGPAVRDALSAFTEETGVAVQLELPTQLPLASGPRARFVLALQNLLRNAVQAAGPQILLKVTAELAERKVIIFVDDNGPGVPRELRGEVFLTGVTLRPGGTGHGLALVREVVQEEMGGSVACLESSLGGARFALHLPSSQGEG